MTSDQPVASWFVDFGPTEIVDEYIEGFAIIVPWRYCGIVQAETRAKAKAVLIREVASEHELLFTDRAFIRKIVPEKEYYDGEYYDAVPNAVLDAADRFWGINQ